MVRLWLGATLALIAVAGCRKTGDDEYEVQKPVVGTETDTVHTPDVRVGTDTDTVTVPKVTTEKQEIKKPTVEVEH